MKTLDEVITELEDEGLFPDALHYLKVFQRHEERVRGQLDDLKEEYRPNDPLTWDELKAMEGKPVWIEGLKKNLWGLVDGDYINAFGAEMLTVKILHDLIHLDKREQGKSWQAYRKERK